MSNAETPFKVNGWVQVKWEANLPMAGAIGRVTHVRPGTENLHTRYTVRFTTEVSFDYRERDLTPGTQPSYYDLIEREEFIPEDPIAILEKMGEKYPDEKRDPYIVDSSDWDETIAPIMTAWVTMLLQISMGDNPTSVSMCVPMLRVASEVIYILGYERGKHEQQKGDDDLSVFEF